MSEYDPALGRYVECGEMVVASDDDLGQMAKCPKCGQLVEIPYNYSAGHKRPEDERQKPSKRQAKSKSKRGTAAETTIANAGSPSGKKTKKSGGKAAGKRSSVKADIMAMEFEGSDGRVHDSGRKRCPECGSLLDDFGKCSLCYYVEPKFESKTAAMDDIKIRLAGCQLWLSEIVSDGASAKMLTWGGVALISVLYVVMMAVSILLAQISGLIFAVVLTVVFVAFILTVIKAGQMARDRKARIGWWMSPFWNLVLLISRLMKWQRYDQRLAGRMIVSLKNDPVTDEKIPYIEDLKKCQVLDLENTLVSDQGLLHLYGLTQLNCLVLRKTSVTHDGVFRLQQAHPRLWIWY